MPSNEEVARIEAEFARRYDLDLQGIHKDVAALRTAVAAPSADGAATFYTYNGTEAFVPDLETIDAAQITPDARLNIRQIEANFDEATKYSQACLQLRTQYGELARHRNDTRFKGEEFVRLDAVHLQEVEAGLYKLPWQEAADEAAGLELAVTQANVQQSIPEAMTNVAAGNQKYSALLSDQTMANQIAWNAFITQNVANSLKDQVGQRALSTAEYKVHMELATWLETLAAAKSAVAQLSSKLAIAKRKEEYLRKDENFKLERAYISRQLAWLQIAEHCRSGSELNYDERLRATKSLFDANLQALIERALLINEGLKNIYQIDLTLGDLPKGGILDHTAAWLVKASDIVSKWKRTQRLTIVQIAGTDKLTVADGGAFDIVLKVEEQSLPSREALLRGINLEFAGDRRAPISADVVPPAGVTIGNSGPLHFGRVCPVAPGLDIRPQHSDQLWNGPPKGEWRIRGSLAPNTASVDQIIMYLWVVSP